LWNIGADGAFLHERAKCALLFTYPPPQLGKHVAQEVITRIVDDIDGGEADQTVVFSWGSAQYEIDLNDKNVEKMAKALQPYIEKARKVSRAAATSRPKSSGRAARTDLQDVRAWAHSNGHAVSDRGRVPQTVLDAYDAAH
jgi:hypothetical protein